jgi:hypothetical protein
MKLRLETCIDMSNDLNKTPRRAAVRGVTCHPAAWCQRAWRGTPRDQVPVEALPDRSLGL